MTTIKDSNDKSQADVLEYLLKQASVKPQGEDIDRKEVQKTLSLSCGLLKNFILSVDMLYNNWHNGKYTSDDFLTIIEYEKRLAQEAIEKINESVQLLLFGLLGIYNKLYLEEKEKDDEQK